MDAALLEGGGIILGLTKPVYPVFFPVFSEFPRWRQVRLRLRPPPAILAVQQLAETRSNSPHFGGHSER